MKRIHWTQTPEGKKRLAQARRTRGELLVKALSTKKAKPLMAVSFACPHCGGLVKLP